MTATKSTSATTRPVITATQLDVAQARIRANIKAKQAINYKDTHDDFTSSGHILTREPANTEKIGGAALRDYFQQSKFMIPTEEA